MSGRGDWTLEEWVECCDRDALDGLHEQIAGSAWSTAEITPPPVLSPPRTRIPLQRARDLLRGIEQESDPERKRSRCVEARAWLSHPHPRTAPRQREEMSRLSRWVVELMAMSGAPE